MSEGLASQEVGIAHVVVTDRAQGSFRVDQDDPRGLEERRRLVVDLPWVWLKQVHGSRVVTADSIEAAGREADALVTTVPGIALAIHTADCAPVVFFGETTGWVGAAHAGWRGLAEGVLESTAERMRQMGESHLTAKLGPCICPADYEFGERELARLAEHLGEGVRSTTADGRPAFDMREGVRSALARADVPLVEESSACTAELSDRYFSHRARGEDGRQAMVVWRQAP